MAKQSLLSGPWSCPAAHLLPRLGSRHLMILRAIFSNLPIKTLFAQVSLSWFQLLVVKKSLTKALLLLFNCKVMSNTFVTPKTIASLAPLSKAFPRQEYWSGFHFSLQGIFLARGSNLHLLHWQAGSLALSRQGRPI